MSFITDIFGGGDQADAARDAAQAQIKATREAIAAQERASELGLGFLQPFSQIGQRGVELSGFLADPQAQFEFLQSNPLFQMSLDQLNTGTAAQAAARGRLSAGDTLQQLQQNALLAAQPLISQQRQDIGNLLNLGTGIAQSQANTALGVGSNVSNLLQNIGQAQAGGIVGAQNAQTAGAQNLLGGLFGGLAGGGAIPGITGIAGGGGLGALLGGLFGLSDSRLKENVEWIGRDNGYRIYKWDWNDEAYKKFGITGSAKGVMSVDVREKDPDAISNIDGYDVIDYEMIGIKPEYN